MQTIVLFYKTAYMLINVSLVLLCLLGMFIFLLTWVCFLYGLRTMQQNRVTLRVIAVCRSALSRGLIE